MLAGFEVLRFDGFWRLQYGAKIIFDSMGYAFFMPRRCKSVETHSLGEDAA